MAWKERIGETLAKYRPPVAESPNAAADLDTVASVVPERLLIDAIAGAFRSDQTPAAGQMVASVFQSADGAARAALLGQILTVLAPVLAQGVFAVSGVTLQQILMRGRTEVTPAEAERISPDDVRVLAENAVRRDPSTVAILSRLLAEKPELMRGLEAPTIAFVLSEIAAGSGA